MTVVCVLAAVWFMCTNPDASAATTGIANVAAAAAAIPASRARSPREAAAIDGESPMPGDHSPKSHLSEG